MMSKQRTIIAVVALLIAAAVLMLPGCFPIMLVTDGCACGHQRTWYEMPDSFWSRKQLFMRVDKVGDATHVHQLWEAQWGVWFDLPWCD